MTWAIDQSHYHELADWAENPDRQIHPERGHVGAAAAEAAQALLHRVAGAPILDQ